MMTQDAAWPGNDGRFQEAIPKMPRRAAYSAQELKPDATAMALHCWCQPHFQDAITTSFPYQLEHY